MSIKFTALATVAVVARLRRGRQCRRPSHRSHPSATNWVAQASTRPAFLIRLFVDGTYEKNAGFRSPSCPAVRSVNNSRPAHRRAHPVLHGAGTLGQFSAVNEGVPMLIVRSELSEGAADRDDASRRHLVFRRALDARPAHHRRRGLRHLLSSISQKANGWDAAKRVPYTFNPAPLSSPTPPRRSRAMSPRSPSRVEQEAGIKPDVGCSWPTTLHGLLHHDRGDARI